VIVSGQVPFDRLAALASAGADIVAIGAITDSAPAADVIFEFRSE
jgi:nicotinate-nucleotide pyrophosphorylase